MNVTVRAQVEAAQAVVDELAQGRAATVATGGTVGWMYLLREEAVERLGSIGVAEDQAREDLANWREAEGSGEGEIVFLETFVAELRVAQRLGLTEQLRAHMLGDG